MPNALDQFLEPIIDDIAANKFVLILGPDLYANYIDGKIWNRTEYFKKIEADNKGSFFADNDELFSTNKDNYLSIAGKVKDYYNTDSDIKLLELIASIRFSLIINTSPDISLENFLRPREPNAAFEYFEGEIDKKKNLICDIEHPVIYNVFGRVDKRQSLIINHEEMFKHLTLLLPKDSFPLAINETIRKAGSFLFLGFKFDSWKYQILSYKILDINEGRDQQNNIRLSSTMYSLENPVNIIMTAAAGIKFRNESPAQLLEGIIKKARIVGNMANIFRNIEKKKQYFTYLSYSHQNENCPNLQVMVDIFLDSIDKENQKNQNGDIIDTIYDKRDLQYGQSIDSFMTRIGTGKIAVLIVSDKYLKSVYCMTEALRVYKYNNEDQRVFIILIEDRLMLANEENGKMVIDENGYKIHWKNLYAEQARKSKREDKVRLENYFEISEFIDDFIRKIDDYKSFRICDADYNEGENTINKLSTTKEFEFIKFMDALVSKVKED